MMYYPNEIASGTAGQDSSGACVPGSFNPGYTQQVCTEAFAGYYVANSGETSQTACSSGYFSGSGATSCTLVPAGYQATTPASTPTPCMLGWYSSGSATTCIICPAGYVCPRQDGSQNFVASGGSSDPYYTLPGSYYRNVVQPGFSKTFGSSSPPLPCATKGYYWNYSTGTCIQCSAGYACPSSLNFEQLPCPAGFYSATAGQSSCTPCPAGSYCPINSNNLYDLQPYDCPAGTYNFGYAYSYSQCIACPIGYFCPTQSSYPQICSQGTASQTTGQQRCTPLTGNQMALTLQSPITGVSCPLGQYYVYNGTYPLTRCNKCPVGFYCNNVNAMPIPCPSGYYQNQEGQSSCILCPAGQACPYPNFIPFNCPSTLTSGGVQGFTSLAGMTACYPVFTACTAGYYVYPAPTQQQYICPEGYACPYCQSAPIMCPIGYYSNTGAMSCTLCEAGYKCPSPYYSMRTACTAGYYSAAGSQNCYPIPSHMTGTLSTRPSWCTFGTYSALTANNCVVCPSGSWCPSDNVAPIICPMSYDNTAVSSYTSLPNEVNCFPLLSTRGGTGALYAGSASNVFDLHINPGYYSMTGGATQFVCPKGRQCLFPNENIFIPCPPGTYDVAGFFDCQPCPEGKVCPIRQKSYMATKTWVMNGFFSPLNTHVDLKIPGGWYTDATQSYGVRPCPRGYYSNDGATGSCTICPIGYACPYASNNPIQCNEGHYAPTTGMSVCTPCTDNQWYNPSTLNCETKPDGYYAIHPIFAVQNCKYNLWSSTSSGSFGNQGIVDCYQQNSLYYAKSSNQFLTCPSGFYCLHSGSATTYTKFPCPPGTYSNGATGSSSMQTQCLKCSAGNYCTGGAASPVTCPAGYVCPAGTAVATQFPCPLGTYNPSTGQTDNSACQVCTGGKLCLEGTSSPFNCPPGQSCSGAPWTSGTCPSGQYSLSGTCTPCPIGMYCPTSSSYGLKCPAGTYSTTTGGKSQSDCILASVGAPIPTYGQTAAPTDYPLTLGYVYPAGTAFSQQISCPAGTVCDSGATAANWVTCPSGFACPQGSSTSTALKCEHGWVCAAGTVDSRQVAPSAGYYVSYYGQSQQACPQGFYCPAGTTRPKSCPLGYYCVAQTLDYRTSPCPNGYYGATIQLTSSSACSACPGGRFCQPGQIIPQLCPKGTFSAGSADSAYTASGFTTPCTQCTAGYYCPYEGLSAPIPCGSGYFSPAGSWTCFRCYAGHLCDSTTTTQAYMEANKCSGVTCLTFQIYELTSSCPSGYYCDPTQFQPIPCPVGTYQSATVAQSSSATCTSVPAGYYNDLQGQNYTQISVKLCSPGYYCAAGSVSMFAAPCAPGTYQSLSGQSSCNACPAGYYCLGATVYPIPCPGGYYCTVSQYQPTACPIGYFGAHTMLTSLSGCTICTQGMYCAEPGITAPSGLCNAGYYCTAGATIPQQNGCPAGAYCEAGSFTPKACPAGYYNQYTLQKSFQNCAQCTPGSYCDGSISTSVTGPCKAGWYCLAGSRVIDEYPAPPGYYTLSGASAPVACSVTTYNPYYHQSSCLTCPAGFYCDQTGMAAPTICPAGKFCVVGSQTPVVCPIGTYNPVTGATNQNSYCLQCPPGRYCGSTSLTAPTGDCAAGYYCKSGAITNKPAALDLVSGRWDKCSPGSYCPLGTAYPYPCPIGTFSTAVQLTDASFCTQCTAGYYCQTTGLTAVTGQCDAGYYCPGGDSQPRLASKQCTAGNYCPVGSSAMIPCSAGYYQHLNAQASCITCPAGYYCLAAATAPIICPVGSFCPAQSTAAQLCPAGQYMPDLGASAGCLSCPAGQYCQTAGLSAPTGICQAGYYCTLGAAISNPNSASQGGNKCPQGYYCPAGSGFKLSCPPGWACPNQGMTDADVVSPGNSIYKCAAGYYCTLAAITTTPVSSSQGGSVCTVGNYCPLGTSSPYPCPRGTYLGSTGGTSLSSCIACPIGQYCHSYASSTYQVCDEGWFCDGSEVSGTPWDSVNNVPKICPVGYYCTSGIKTACSSSSYQDQIGQNACKTCPAGFQCTSTAISECGQSNYCPAGQMYATACAAGYYTLQTTASASAECIICPKGFVCSCTQSTRTVGSTTVTYCTGSSTIVPCPAGYYCDKGTSSATVQCQDGYYCPAGTPYELPCPPGYHCDGLGNTASSWTDCPAGSYCSGGTSTLKANILTCNAGYYCPLNSAFQHPCEIGTYNSNTGSTSSAACLICPAGSTCTTRGQVLPNTAAFSCESGYYCADTGKAACPSGYYCPTNSKAPTGCAQGYYAPQTNMASCTICPAGYYCGDDLIDVLGATQTQILADSAIPCPIGYYCAKGSYLATVGRVAGTETAGVGCPVGTYNPNVGARSVADCIQCPEGYMCTTVAISSVVSVLPKCTEGNYCPNAAVSKAKISCPAGAYCPAGSAYYTACPMGYYNNLKGQTSNSTCTACDANYYCPARGITSQSKLPCGDGFICNGGAMTSQPYSTQGGSPCPIGTQCIGLTQTGCSKGTYQPNVGQSSCLDCPAGLFCNAPSMTEPVSCPVGSYCPANSPSVTSYNSIPCPAGTYSDNSNIGDVSQCIPCPPGQFCTVGTTSMPTSNNCDEKYFCPLSSTKANNYSDAYEFGSTVSGLCPAGYNCPAGTIAPVPCAVGTYQPSAGQATCLDCSPGYYCDQQGMSELSTLQKCYPGYYCLSGSLLPNPKANGGTITEGDICQPGFYCQAGSSSMTPCAQGYYEPRTGSAACQECPAGYYCAQTIVNSVTTGAIKPVECQSGYCAKGAWEPTLCPDGYYGSADLKKMMTEDDCPYCPNGYYCQNGNIIGACDAGYFCDFGASQYRESSKLCPAGHYCPSGTLLPIPCPTETYWSGTGARDVSYCGPCAPGFYCLDNDPVSRVCPVGHFCPAKTKEPIPCWLGTYNPYSMQPNSTNCLPCPAGSNCNQTGTDDYHKFLCPVGNYCPTAGLTTGPLPCPAGTYRNTTGAASIKDCWACPQGFFCVEGSETYTPCDSGYICPQGSSQQQACSPGTFCPAMSSVPTPCPKGFYCPTFRTDIYQKCDNGTYCAVGQSSQTSCPNGFFGTSVTWNYNVSVSCMPCGPGQYSDQVSRTCKPCDAGYICYAGATTARPTTPAQNGTICSPGFYCLKGSVSAIACPVGTYSNVPGNGQLNQCLPCPINTYGTDVGQTQCQKCANSTNSPIGSTTCSCIGLNRQYLTQSSSCVCLSGYTPTDGSDAAKDGKSDCQKQIYDRCNVNQIRDSHGACRDPTNCTLECNGGQGTIEPNFGICQCANITTTAQVCNADCQKSALVTTFTSNGQVAVFNPATNTTTMTKLPNTLGSAKCSAEDQSKCQLTPIGMSSSGGSFTGSYDLPASITQSSPKIADMNQQVISKRKSSFYKGNATINTDGRQLQTTSASAQSSVIENPVICTIQGSALLFGDLSSDSYPVYQKDNLLNSNPNFDYSSFTSLPLQLKGLKNQNFVFTFIAAGTYVFASSANPSKLMIVAVMGNQQKCPVGGAISPLTYASLLKVGAYQQSVLEPPDWTFFFATLIVFIILIILAVLLVSYIARRDWKQSKIQTILYQQQNYKAVERDDPQDARAIVSINTDSASFMFRAQGHDDGKDMSERLVDRMKKGKNGQTKQNKHERSRKDLSLGQVEHLKDALHKHLKEIKKLRALRYGKDGIQVQDELGNEQSDYTSSDEDELNTAIANVKKLISNARAVLRGEGEEELQIFTDDTKAIEAINVATDQKAQREEALRLRKLQLEENQRLNDEKFRRKIFNETETAVSNLDDLKNKVLEMQVESAYDRGKAFQERMQRTGANENELSDMMIQLQTKMERVEDLLLDDKDRQNEMLKHQLEMRRSRRRKLNEKLVEVDEELYKHEYDKADQKNAIVQELQEELKAEMAALEADDLKAREELNKKFEQIKIEKLADFQDRLRNAGGTKDFQNILEQFQIAQIQVDKELKRQVDKENEKLNRELKSRKAKAKAEAEIRRSQRFKELEINQSIKLSNSIDGKAKIEEALITSERKDEIMGIFANRLNSQINSGNQLVSEMERKRRDEEALLHEHERKQRKLQAEAIKEATILNKEVDAEISKLSNQNSYEPFQALVNERSILQKQLQSASTDEEKNLLMKQLKEIDEQVKNQLGAELKDQDAALKRRLDARRLKRDNAIERERILKESLLQERIKLALENSSNFAVYKNELTAEAFESIISQMKLELTPEEIPAAMENILDDKHHKELSDWILKLYEQKAIELKEEILSMMEEKIAKQQVLKMNCEDRRRGIDAIISRTDDAAVIADLKSRKEALQGEMIKEVNKLESDFVSAELRKTREIQGRCTDREHKALAEMSEMHFAEKKKIFEQYLPDSLMKDLYEELGKREREDMALYQAELDAMKQQKLQQMEEEDRQVQAELVAQHSKLQNLTDQEQAIVKRELIEARRQKQAQREKHAVINSQEVISKIREDMQKGLEGLSGAYEEEHKRQLAMMEARLANRGQAVQNALEQKKLDALRKTEQAELEKLKENDKIRDLRRRKAQLLETITNGQKLIMKGCYSRPLWSFNQRLHDATVKNDDIAQLLQSQSNELKQQVMGTLLKKVSDLEEKVSTDVNKPVPRQNPFGLKSKQNGTRYNNDDTMSNVSSSNDKLANAKSLLGNLLKKKF